MEKQTLGHQQKYVTKDERVENLWKKLIGQETDLSEETIAWMARRILQLTAYMPYGCALIAYRKQNGDFYMGRGTGISFFNLPHFCRLASGIEIDTRDGSYVSRVKA